MNERPNSNVYFLSLAKLTSSRATCVRRRVGAILVDKNGYVLATGYNGVPKKFKHCTTEKPCLGANFKSGEGLDKCQAIHAEQNAILQCADTQQIDTAYLTLSPCITCIKLLLNTSCKKIVYIEQHPGYKDVHKMWGMSPPDSDGVARQHSRKYFGQPSKEELKFINSIVNIDTTRRG